MLGVLAIVGALMLISGAVVLVFRRRVATNMSKAGIVAGTRISPVAYTVLISVMLLILGAGALLLIVLTSSP